MICPIFRANSKPNRQAKEQERVCLIGLFVNPEGEPRMFFRGAGKLLPDSTVSFLRTGYIFLLIALRAWNLTILFSISIVMFRMVQIDICVRRKVPLENDKNEKFVRNKFWTIGRNSNKSKRMKRGNTQTSKQTNKMVVLSSSVVCLLVT